MIHEFKIVLSRVEHLILFIAGRQGIALLDADGNTNFKEMKASGTDWLSSTTIGDPEVKNGQCSVN